MYASLSFMRNRTLSLIDTFQLDRAVADDCRAVAGLARTEATFRFRITFSRHASRNVAKGVPIARLHDM